MVNNNSIYICNNYIILGETFLFKENLGVENDNKNHVSNKINFKIPSNRMVF